MFRVEVYLDYEQKYCKFRQDYLKESLFGRFEGFVCIWFAFLPKGIRYRGRDFRLFATSLRVLSRALRSG
jgi:hypothetical protein